MWQSGGVTTLRFACRSLLSLGLILALGSSLAAWGRKGHFWIAEKAVDSVGPELRQLLERHRSELVRLSVAADDRRPDDAQERFRHYIDLDNYGAFPYPGFDLDQRALERVWGKTWVRHQGTVLWVIQRRYGELVEAFKSRKIGSIRLAAADLCHYVSDLHQPFHATGNYDGQKTGQEGIHSRFESDLVKNMEPRLRFESAPLRRYPKPSEAMYQVALDSLQWVDNILTADVQIVDELAIDRSRYADVPVPERRFPDPYYERLEQRLGAMTQSRMSAAAVTIASLWQQAWKEAGRSEF